jgi:histidine triad (HIT) family protein
MSDSCIFCKIIQGETEASHVYKDEFVSAFMDLHPVNKGHVLVIPNIHRERFNSLPIKYVERMFLVGQKVLIAIEKSAIRCEGANLFLSDGEIAGQEVLHSHLHIAPRFKGDGHRMGFSSTDSEESYRDRLDQAALAIKKNL